MPPTLADRLEHVLAAIETIENALATKQFEDLQGDLMLRLAIERLKSFARRRAAFPTT
jgi:hypothetical protein